MGRGAARSGRGTARGGGLAVTVSSPPAVAHPAWSVPVTLLAVVVLLLAGLLVTRDAPPTAGTGPGVGTVDDGQVLLPDRSVAGTPQDTAGATSPARTCPTDPDTCRRWQARIPGDEARTARAFDGAAVTVGADGRVTARDLRDGALRWRVTVPQRPDDVGENVWAWYRTSLIGARVDLLDPVAGTVVVRRSETVSFLDPLTGETLGQTRLPIDADATTSTGPWLIASDGRRLAAVGIPGVMAWERSVPDGHAVHLLPHGTYLSATATVVRLSGNTGREAWRAEVGGPPRPLPATAGDGSTLVAVDGAEPALVALGPTDGAPRWRVELDGEVERVAVGSDRIVVAVRTGSDPQLQVLALDEDGRFVRRRTLLLRDVDGVDHLTMVGRQIVAVTRGERPEVVVATPDGFARLRRPAFGPTQATAPEGGTLLIADRAGVRSVALTTGTDRYHVPLTDAAPVPGAPTLFSGAEGLVDVVPRP